MPKAPHTFVDFHGDFPVPDKADVDCARQSVYAIPGKEVAEYLAGELRAKGLNVEGPQPADFEYVISWVGGGWRFELYVGVDDFCAMDRWNVQAAVQRRGFFRRTLQSADRHDFVRLLEALDRVLKESPRIRDIRWFPHFEIPGELNRQAGYAGPMSDERVWRPEVTPVYRLRALHGKWCDAGWPWCVRGAIGSILLYVLLAVAGFPKSAQWAVTLTVLAAIAPFIGIGTGAFLLGLDLFQQRRRAGQTISAIVGLVLLLLAGAFFVWIAVGAVWGFVGGLVRRT